MILAVASVLAASGLTRASEIQVSRAYGQARVATESVVPFRAALPALAGIGVRSASAASVFAIADSTDAQRIRLCDLARELTLDRRIILLALSEVDSGCGSAVRVVTDPRDREAVYRELAGARLVVLSTEGTALYSRRYLPTSFLLRELADFFSTPAGAVGQRPTAAAPAGSPALVDTR